MRISPGVSLGTRIAQSFGIPKTAEKLGFFRLQLCENLFLRVFHVELKYSAIIWHPKVIAEKAGRFRLRLCENLYLRVFHWELK